jgi:uncharacterized SAM-binding protein YcdF (DUF218 family)
MDIFFNAIKGQFNSINFILLLILIAYLLYRVNRLNASGNVLIFCVVFFLITSTGYLPGYLTYQIESSYSPFLKSNYRPHRDTVYVHALGGGYTMDERLNANSQLSHSSLGRLVEAIRVARLFDNSMLVLSGPIVSGNESLAAVERRAAVSLGFDSARIAILETPVTTLEEAKFFAAQFGTDVDLILVTDAVHMPRAIKFFNQQALNAFPAPANYLIKKDNNPVNLKWMPSAENLLLMDRIYREWLGNLKGYLAGYCANINPFLFLNH